MSIVGSDQLPKSGYLRAKVAQEKLIEESEIPYSIVRATQFAEFTDAITASMTVGDEVRVPDALIQPIAADDLAAEVARVAEGEPLGGIQNIGGPEKILVRADGPRGLGPTRRSQDRRQSRLLRDTALHEQPGYRIQVRSARAGRRQRTWQWH